MNTIKKSLLNIAGVESVVFSEDKESVEIIGNADRALVVADLARMGYPEKGSNNLLHKATSFVSCAVGRVSGEE